MPGSSSTSSTSSIKSVSRARRPPSPVSMYGSGAGFGMAAPKAPRPLAQLEKRPTREAKGKGKAHTRSSSTSTNTSALSESSANNTPSGNSLKSRASSKGFSLSWKKKTQPSTTSLPTSPMDPVSPSTETAPTQIPPSNQSEDSIGCTPSEAESRVRQLDKVTRTFGERVPVEFILHGQRHEYEHHNPPTVIQPTLTDEPTDPILPQDDVVRKKRPLPPTPIDVPAANVISACTAENSPSSSCRTSSPVLPDQDYQELKGTRAQSPSPVVDSHSKDPEPESPILFSSSPASVSPSTTKDESERPNENTPPFALYHPRPKGGTWSALPSPSLAVTNKISSVDNGANKIPTSRRPSTSTTSPTLLQAPVARRPRSSVRPKSSHAGSTPFWGDPAPHPRADSPFQDNAIPIHAWLNTTWSSPKKGCIVRQEGGQGWSGEWNRSDMQDVITTLRQLK